ncbi:hypothetical protein ASE29_34770, partial [Ensifer sp. Root74]
WLRTATRRYRPQYSNPKPLEQTQNWIKLGGKVNVDKVILIRHMNYFVEGAAERPLADREHGMDFGGPHALPNVLCEGHGGRPIPQFVLDVLRAYPHDDPRLRMFAEYNPQDMIFWFGGLPQE